MARESHASHGVRCQAVSLEPIGVVEQVDVRDLVDAERAQVVENEGAQRGLELPNDGRAVRLAAACEAPG
jgi:hypothetical protein